MPGVRSVLFTVEILSLPASRGCRDYHRRGLERKSCCRMRLRRWYIGGRVVGCIGGRLWTSLQSQAPSSLGRATARTRKSDAIPARASESRTLCAVHTRASKLRSRLRAPRNVIPARASAPERRDPRQSEQVAKQVASAPKRKTPDRSRGRREGKGLVRRSLATRLTNNVHPIRESANPCGNFSWNSPINLREPQKTTRGVRREASTSATKRPRQGIGSPETPERGRGAEPSFRLG